MDLLHQTRVGLAHFRRDHGLARGYVRNNLIPKPPLLSHLGSRQAPAAHSTHRGRLPLWCAIGNSTPTHRRARRHRLPLWHSLLARLHRRAAPLTRRHHRGRRAPLHGHLGALHHLTLGHLTWCATSLWRHHRSASSTTSRGLLTSRKRGQHLR